MIILCQVVQIYERVVALRNVFLLNILRVNQWDLTKFGTYTDIDEISVGIDMRQFSQQNITELWPLTQFRISFRLNKY